MSSGLVCTAVVLASGAVSGTEQLVFWSMQGERGTWMQRVSTAGRRTVGCAVVYGPGELVPVTVNGVTPQKIAGFNPNGVLMRVPSGNAYGDYLAFDTSASLRLGPTAVTGSAPNRRMVLTSGGQSLCNLKTTSSSNNYGVELTPTTGIAQSRFGPTAVPSVSTFSFRNASRRSGDCVSGPSLIRFNWLYL